MWGFHYTRGDVGAARQVADETMAVAESLNDDGLLKDAHRTLGASLQQAGELSSARAHLEKALALRAAPRFIGRTGPLRTRVECAVPDQPKRCAVYARLS
jgi:hypothetical protein